MAKDSDGSSNAAPVLMLTGPTGIGKTGVAVQLAQRHALEIISADSMQIYRGMEIGTAQPTPEELRAARFHLCGAIDPTESFDVRKFVEMCDRAHREIVARGARPVYVGGTGMYMRALRWGLFEGAGRDERVRATLEQEAESLGDEEMHRRLAQVDPTAAERIDPADRLRVIRALEVHTLTGQRLSDLQSQWERPRARFAHLMVVLTAPREWLRQRIAQRTDAMLEAGWIDEVRALLERGVAPTQHCMKALGYAEIARHLNGELDREEMRQLIVTRTHQFAKRQMIWLRRERPAVWLSVDSEAPSRTVERLEKLLAKNESAQV